MKSSRGGPSRRDDSQAESGEVDGTTAARFRHPAGGLVASEREERRAGGASALVLVTYEVAAPRVRGR